MNEDLRDVTVAMVAMLVLAAMTMGLLVAMVLT